MKKKAWIVLGLLCGGLNVFAQNFPFRDTTLPVEDRIEDLISRLSLEEKVNQMLNSTPAIERLGIPPYDWWNECLHGVGRSKYKVTVFPQAVGMASTWNAPLLQQVAEVISDEGRAIFNDAQRNKEYSRYHGLTYWTPNINIFRDPRWGRGQETYGEDPYLTGVMGKFFVNGLQGNDSRYLKASACAKHYGVHSGPEKLRHTFNADVSTYDLWDTYLPAFRELVVKGKVTGVMCAYNAFRGQPCCGSDILMQSILRNKWGFTGYVTSDCGAIDDFFRQHKTHPDAASAAVDAVYHGTDLDCGHDGYIALIKAVKEGQISEEVLDVSLRRLFGIRFRLGLFDPVEEVPYSQIPVSVLECDKHQQMAKQMAQESIVLLKNENNMLPLDKNTLKKVVVMGPNADDKEVLLGNYNGFPTRMLTPLEAIRSRLGDKAEIVYIKGPDCVKNAEPTQIEQWKQLVAGADVAIFIGGITPRLEGEELRIRQEGFDGGDRTAIGLPAVQTSVMQAIAPEVPLVFVMITGSAIAIPWEAQNVPAILNAWYGGQYGGEAIADVLFGDCVPSGKLPVTIYEKDSDLPPFNDYSMENRTYRYFKGKALYPFGYGLSYTQFEYSALDIPSSVPTGHGMKVKVKVTNKGRYAGSEVVQLYVSHTDQKILVPICSLKGFEKVHLLPGESRQITFVLSPEDLACVDEYGNRNELPGNVKISVGGSAPVSSLAPSLKHIEKRVRIEGKAYSIDTPSDECYYMPEMKRIPSNFWSCVGVIGAHNRNSVAEMNREKGLPYHLLCQSLAGLANAAVDEGSCESAIWLHDTDNHDSYTVSKQKLIEMGVRENGQKNGIELACGDFRKIIKGYVLTDVKNNPESAIVASVAAHVYQSIIVDVRDKEFFEKEVFSMTYDATKKTTEDAWKEFKTKCSNKALVIMPVQTAELREFAIKNKLFVLNLNKCQDIPAKGQNTALLHEVLSWLEPNAPVYGWEQGVSEDQFVGLVSKYGHVMIPCDWSYNHSLTALQYSRNQSLVQPKGVDPRRIDYEKKKNYVSFFLSDGDNIQWMMNGFANDYYTAPESASVRMAYGVPVASLAMMAPMQLDKLMKSQPRNCSVMEMLGGGYYYVDTYSEKGNRKRNLKVVAERLAGHMSHNGIKVLGVMAMDATSSKAKEAYQAYVDANEQLEGIVALQYTPYAGGQGEVIWVKNKKGYSIPVITVKYSIWNFDGKNQEREGSPSYIASKLKEEKQEESYSAICVHAWSRFENGVRGAAAAQLCAKQLDSDFEIVNIQELIWRMRMSEYPTQTKKYINEEL